MQDLISITIPTYNGEKYIQQCIESIQCQNFPHEIIIIDDISTDKTVEIARSMNCKVVINEKHKGQVAGKNTGIKLSNGNYWLTIDQDDMLTENALEKLYFEMQKNPSNMIVMAQLKDFAESEENQKFCKQKPFRGILTGTTLFKKEVFNLIGDFREDIITGDVIDLTNRLKILGIEIINLDYVSCKRRIHNSNFGRTNQKDEYKDYAKVLRERLVIKS